MAEKAYEKHAEELERQIARYALEKFPGFEEFLETLTEELQTESKRNVASEQLLKAELVEIYALLDDTRGFHPTRRFFGLYRHKTDKQHSRRAKKALDSLAMTYANVLTYKRKVFDGRWRQRLLWTAWRLKRQTMKPGR